MGVVYLADGPDGPVALKVVRRLLAADDTFRTRFRREVLAARRVSGRGVVELLDADTEGDRPYLAMGYVDGPTLLDEVTTSGPVRGERLRALMVALAEAVDTIHRSGVTHRDLKPGNVLLAEDQPVVVDFGVATATEATSITVVGTVMGSPGWMAPEQVTGGTPSPAMDVFAWGTLVAWAATGRNPFGTGRPEAVAYRIIHDEPDLEGVPADVRPVVADALAKEPTARPTAAAVLARLLDQAPQAEPRRAGRRRHGPPGPDLGPDPDAAPGAAAASPAPVRRGPPPPRRGRARRALAVALVLLVAAGAGLGIGLGIQAYRDRNDEQAAGGSAPSRDDHDTPRRRPVPTRPLSVRWVIADDIDRPVGEACQADPPRDPTATLEVQDTGGHTLAGPTEAGEGQAEPGTGLVDDVFNFTSCVYTVDFEAVPEVDAYIIIPSSGDEPLTITAVDLEAAEGQVELVADTGGGLLD